MHWVTHRILCVNYHVLSLKQLLGMCIIFIPLYVDDKTKAQETE